MSLKDTRELEEARAKLEEAKAELERLSALTTDQEAMITSLKLEIESLNEENGKLNRENAMLDSENVELVKSLEQKCLELVKAKNTPRVVVTAPLTNNSSASMASVSSSVKPVKGVVKMSYAEANPDLMRELRWENFWNILERWLLPVSALAVIMYALWRYWL